MDKLNYFIISNPGEYKLSFVKIVSRAKSLKQAKEIRDLHKETLPHNDYVIFKAVKLNSNNTKRGKNR